MNPLCGVAIGLAESRSDLLDLATELGHQPAGLPLSLPPNIPVDPEAPTAVGDDARRLGIVARADELAGVCEQRALLEAEGVDVAEMTDLDLRLREPEVGLDLGRQGHVVVGVATSQALGDIADTFDMFLARRVWDHRHGLRRIALHVRTKLADKHVAKQLVPRLGDRGVLGHRQAKAGLHELRELDGRIFLDNRRVVVLVGQPAGDEGLALGAVENGPEHRGRLALFALVEKRDDVVVSDTRWPQHLVDLAIGEALAKNVERQALQLRLVGSAALLQFHQDGCLPVTIDAR